MFNRYIRIKREYNIIEKLEKEINRIYYLGKLFNIESFVRVRFKISWSSLLTNSSIIQTKIAINLKQLDKYILMKLIF